MVTSVLRSAKRAPANVRRLNKKLTSEILFSRRTFAGPRFAERSTGVSFSDRLLSVVHPSVCKQFTFSSPSQEPLGQLQPNLVQSIPKEGATCTPVSMGRWQRIRENTLTISNIFSFITAGLISIKLGTNIIGWRWIQGEMITPFKKKQHL